MPWPRVPMIRPSQPSRRRRRARRRRSRVGRHLAVAADQARGAVRAGRRLGLHLAAGRREAVAAARPDRAGRQQAGRRRQSRRRGRDQGAGRRLHLPDDLRQLRDQLDPAQADVRFAERHRGDRPVHRRADRAVRQSVGAGQDPEGAGRALPSASPASSPTARAGRAGWSISAPSSSSTPPASRRRMCPIAARRWR